MINCGDFPLDGVDQRPLLLRGEPSAREDLLVNIERSNPTTAPPALPGGRGCTGVGQYVAIVGWHKIIIGGGGGIMMIAGLSGIFTPISTFLTVILAVSPVPLAVIFLGLQF